MKVLRKNQIIEEYAPDKRQAPARTAMADTATAILACIRAADARGEAMPSIRELQAACGISSTSVVTYALRALARRGYITLGAKGCARSYRLTPMGRGKLDRVTELENTLRLIRRYIESEDRPGDRTTDIYNLTAQALPY